MPGSGQREEWGVTAEGYGVSFLGGGNYSKTECSERELHNFVNVLKNHRTACFKGMDTVACKLYLNFKLCKKNAPK